MFDLPRILGVGGGDDVSEPKASSRYNSPEEDIDESMSFEDHRSRPSHRGSRKGDDVETGLKRNRSMDSGGTEPYDQIDDEDWEHSVTRINLVFFVLYVGCSTAMYVLFFLNDRLAEYDIPIYYTTSSYDTTLGSFALAQQEVLVLPLFTFVLAFMTSGCLTTCVPLIPFLSNSYFDQLETGMNMYKWFDFFVSSTALNLLVATQLGVADLNSLIPVTGLSFSSAFFFSLYERINTVNGLLVESTWKSPIVYAIISWIFIWPTFILSALLATSASTGFDFGQFPVWMYAVAACSLLYTVLMWFNEVMYFSGCGPWGRHGYEFLEKVQITISFLMKATVGWLT